MIKYFLIAIFAIFANLVIANDSPIVSIDCGQLKGKAISTSKGECSMFLGVPFAAPPIGELRFDKPQPPTCWKEIRDATEFGPVCIQDASNATDPKTESEDCLYLNVFVPNEAPEAGKTYPVMVFIHGGGFTFGSAKEYGDVGICENLASRNVIVVTVQYRLNLYGFVSTGDEAASGNYGIWDQVSSLEWVKRNIEQFGGDPNRVTIFGESAGGASVSLLTYTPVAKDLFHQSIAESGSALSSWGGLNDACIGTTKKLAKAANCTDADPNLVVKCLRQLSTPALQKIYHSLNLTTANFSLNMAWSIRVDGELFQQKELIEFDNEKPAIIGVNSIEIPGIDYLLPYADFLINKTLKELFPGKDEKSKFLKQAARYVYVDSRGDRTNPIFLCQQFSQLISDTMFRGPAAKEAFSKTSAGRSVWTYKFDYYSKNVFPADYPFKKGAPHAHELCYIFLKPLPPGRQASTFSCPSTYEGTDREVADFMGEMWTNFAIKGNPSPSSITWPQFHNVTNAHTMHIRSQLDTLPDFYMDIANFWNFFVPNIEPEFNFGKANDQSNDQIEEMMLNQRSD